MTNKIIESKLNENIIKLLEAEKTTYIAARSSKLQQGAVEKILNKIQEKYNLDSQDQAIAILAVLFQQGGTARSCDGNMCITLFGQEIKLADIRKIMKETSCNKAERKLARSLANQIYAMSLILEIPGNLYNKIQKQDFEKVFTMEEKVWLSDFQSDNDECPTKLRTLILETFKKKEKSTKKK